LRPALPHLRHLFLARNGETDWNLAGRWQGHTDVPLNATGRAQAGALAERLRGEGIATVGASDLSRARHTAEIVAAALGVPVALVDPDLREQRFGRFEAPPASARTVIPKLGSATSRIRAPDRRVGSLAPRSSSASCARCWEQRRGCRRLRSSSPVEARSGRCSRPPGYDRRLLLRIPNGGVVRVSLAAGRPVAAVWVDG
jgi:probable phosphoglycerate mutase